MDNENNSTERKISITGTNNRYQIKKLTQSRVQPKKKRVETTSWKITDEHLSFSSQIEILNKIKLLTTEKKELPEEIKLAISHIERKLNSYKHQDIDKKMLDTNNFIKFDETIEKLLGPDYIVKASFGHIRELGKKNELGIEVENNFRPVYKIMKDKSKQIKAIQDRIKTVDRVLLASDEDREGEMIAWSLARELKLTKPNIYLFGQNFNKQEKFSLIHFIIIKLIIL